MFRSPFNNYQNTGWGFPFIWEYVGYPSITYPRTFVEEAKLVEANFLTGQFLPKEVSAGGEEGFTWNTPEKPPRLYAITSGSVFDANKHVAYYSFTISGGTFPHVRMSGDLYTSFSGVVTGNVFDNVPIYSRTTGIISGNARDSGYLYAKQSGYVFNATTSTGSLYGSFSSGKMDNTQGATGMIYCGFSGKFTQPYRDTAGDIYMMLEAINYEDGGARIITTGFVGTGGPIYIRMISISYTNI